MYIEQFHIPKIAHSSYLLGGKDDCAIIDPRRDINIYIDAAKIYTPASANCQFEHQPLQEGDKFFEKHIK